MNISRNICSVEWDTAERELSEHLKNICGVEWDTVERELSEHLKKHLWC